MVFVKKNIAAEQRINSKPTRWTIISSSLLLQRFLKDALQHLGGRVEVEGYIRDQEVLGEAIQFVTHQHSFTSSSITHLK